MLFPSAPRASTGKPATLRKRNPSVPDRSRHEPGGGGLGVGDGFFHGNACGHAGTQSAHEHVARAVGGNNRYRAHRVVAHTSFEVAVDEARGAPA